MFFRSTYPKYYRQVFCKHSANNLPIDVCKTFKKLTADKKLWESAKIRNFKREKKFLFFLTYVSFIISVNSLLSFNLLILIPRWTEVWFRTIKTYPGFSVVPGHILKGTGTRFDILSRDRSGTGTEIENFARDRSGTGTEIVILARKNPGQGQSTRPVSLHWLKYRF